MAYIDFSCCQNTSWLNIQVLYPRVYWFWKTVSSRCHVTNSLLFMRILQQNLSPRHRIITNNLMKLTHRGQFWNRLVSLWVKKNERASRSILLPPESLHLWKLQKMATLRRCILRPHQPITGRLLVENGSRLRAVSNWRQCMAPISSTVRKKLKECQWNRNRYMTGVLRIYFMNVSNIYYATA